MDVRILPVRNRIHGNVKGVNPKLFLFLFFDHLYFVFSHEYEIGQYKAENGVRTGFLVTFSPLMRVPPTAGATRIVAVVGAIFSGIDAPSLQAIII